MVYKDTSCVLANLMSKKLNAVFKKKKYYKNYSSFIRGVLLG